MPIPQRPRYLLIVTQDGYGKRTPLDDIKPRRRGAKGTTALREDRKMGGVALVGDDGDVLIVTKKGRILRVAVKEIAVLSRSGRGGRVIQLDEGDQVVAVLPL
ncbi:MAG: hypothetical protein SLRJCFUN_001981 [Candidatus Fervidibacter sp.]